MHCQMCLSSESPLLLDMRDQFFIFMVQRMDMLTCSNYCKQIKIDNGQSAKICKICQPKLTAEYISKFLKSEASITDEQSIIPIPEIKEEPEPNIASEWILKNYTAKICDLANEIVEPKKKITTEAVLYQIMFPEHEIKEEPELQIDDEHVESDQDIKTGADVTIDNTEVSVTTVPENHQQSNHSECEESKNYQCSQCREIFETDIDFDMHLKETHPENSKFNCVKSYISKYRLTQHLDTHSDLKKYPCKNCSEAFNTKRKLYLHLKSTHSMEEFQCHYCSVIKNSINSIRKHLMCHREATLECSHCGNKFKTLSSLDRHQLTHVDTKTNHYHCKQSQCTAAFKLPKYLNMHMKTVHSVKKFKCLYCVKTFKLKTNMLIHIDTHSDTIRYPCKNCSEAFNTKSKLFFHFQKTHSMDEFQCHYCSAIKNSKQKMLRHLMCHRQATYKCSHCEKKIKTLSNLVAHQLTHIDTKTYHCNYGQCAATFKTQTYLKKHMETVHSGEKIKCLYCIKTFNYKPKLTQHMDTHFDLKKYPCKDCSKAFNTKAKLYIHLKSTHSILKFQCHFCSAIKNTRHKINRHVMCHIEATQKCFHCEKKFKTLNKLKRHQLTHMLKLKPITAIKVNVQQLFKDIKTF